MTDTGTDRRADAPSTTLNDSPIERVRARAEAEYTALEAETWSGLTLAEYVERALAWVRIG